jgi:hypothetical protein
MGSPIQMQSAEVLRTLKQIEYALKVLMALGIVWFFAWILWALASA